jgi:hypothetical protein
MPAPCPGQRQPPSFAGTHQEKLCGASQNVIRSIPERLQAFLSLLLGHGVALPWQQYPRHVILQVGDTTSVLLEGQQTLLPELVHDVLELLPLFRREVLNVDIHDVRDFRHLDLFG